MSKKLMEFAFAIICEEKQISKNNEGKHDLCLFSFSYPYRILIGCELNESLRVKIKIKALTGEGIVEQRGTDSPM